MQKYPIFPERVRRVPKQFSWVDHRLVRDRYIERISHKAGILYLFLITVADRQGLSYYSDAILLNRLCMDNESLDGARHELILQDLIAWEKPIYQILPFEDQVHVPKSELINKDLIDNSRRPNWHVKNIRISEGEKAIRSVEPIQEKCGEAENFDREYGRKCIQEITKMLSEKHSM